MPGRGELTAEITAKSLEVFGYEIGVKALRLIPYILYELPNGGNAKATLDHVKINDDDKYWLKRWTAEGHIKWSPPHITVTKEFYMAINELQWLAYINATEEKK